MSSNSQMPPTDTELEPHDLLFTIKIWKEDRQCKHTNKNWSTLLLTRLGEGNYHTEKERETRTMWKQGRARDRQRGSWDNWRMKIQIQNIWNGAPPAREERDGREEKTGRERERLQGSRWSSMENLSERRWEGGESREREKRCVYTAWMLMCLREQTNRGF